MAIIYVTTGVLNVSILSRTLSLINITYGDTCNIQTCSVTLIVNGEMRGPFFFCFFLNYLQFQSEVPSDFAHLGWYT